MLGYLTSIIGSYQNTQNDWEKHIKNEISAIKIQSVLRGHFTRRIYSNLILFNKNNKFEIDAFKSNKTVSQTSNTNLSLIENEIDNFIKNRKKHFNYK